MQWLLKNLQIANIVLEVISILYNQCNMYYSKFFFFHYLSFHEFSCFAYTFAELSPVLTKFSPNWAIYLNFQSRVYALFIIHGKHRACSQLSSFLFRIRTYSTLTSHSWMFAVATCSAFFQVWLSSISLLEVVAIICFHKTAPSRRSRNFNSNVPSNDLIDLYFKTGDDTTGRSSNIWWSSHAGQAWKWAHMTRMDQYIC